MKTFFALISALALISCADGKSGVPPGGSGSFGAFGAGPSGACEMGMMCVEVYGGAANLQQVCNYGGTYVDHCSTDSLAVKCQMSADSITEIAYFYDNGYFGQDTYVQQCNAAGGTVIK